MFIYAKINDKTAAYIKSGEGKIITIFLAVTIAKSSKQSKGN